MVNFNCQTLQLPSDMSRPVEHLGESSFQCWLFITIRDANKKPTAPSQLTESLDNNKLLFKPTRNNVVCYADYGTNVVAKDPKDTTSRYRWLNSSRMLKLTEVLCLFLNSLGQWSLYSSHLFLFWVGMSTLCQKHHCILEADYLCSNFMGGKTMCIKIIPRISPLI